MTNLTRLPGKRCRYWRDGRCLYEEQLNPGWRRDFRCEVLARWVAEYDDFVLRADAFNLKEERAARLWKNRSERMDMDMQRCPDQNPKDDGTEPGCAWLEGDMCVLRLPPCAGICNLFTRGD